MDVSVVIPCYGSAKTLSALMERLQSAMPRFAEQFEIILVVDDPPDDTWHVAKQLSQRYPHTRAIQLARNYGQQNAYFAGVRAAKYDVIVTMDDDLQHPPEEIGTLLAGLTDSVDLVYAIPQQEEHSYIRSLASRSVKATMARALGIAHAPNISSFRVFRTFLRNGFDNLRGSHCMLDVALSWATTRMGTVHVNMERDTDNSGYTFGSLMQHASNLLLGYSTKPLRFVTYLGAVCGVFGMVLLALVLVDYARGVGRVEGWASLVCVVTLFSAAQMVALGVLGEYLGRIFTSNMGKPSYVIRQIVGNSTATQETVRVPVARR